MPRGRPKGAKNKRTLAMEAFAAAARTDAPAQAGEITPKDYMLGVMNGSIVFDEFKFRAAVAAAPYCHPRMEKAVQSKKEEAANQAKEAGTGKFATPTAPKLVVSNG